MLLVCYSYVLLCTRMYSYVTRMLFVVPVSSFSHDPPQSNLSGVNLFLRAYYGAVFARRS